MTLLPMYIVRSCVQDNHACTRELLGPGMLRRASRRVAKAKAKVAPASSSSGNHGRLDLHESPLMQRAANKVGRGGEASMFRDVAAAALDELEMHGGKFSDSGLHA